MASGSDFRLLFAKTAFIASVLDIDTPVLVFDWPCEPGLLAARISGRPANCRRCESGADLARALAGHRRRKSSPIILSLVANSMGGEVVVSSLQRFSMKTLTSRTAMKEIDHVVLTAPDVDHTAFNEQLQARDQGVCRGPNRLCVIKRQGALLISAPD